MLTTQKKIVFLIQNCTNSARREVISGWNPLVIEKVVDVFEELAENQNFGLTNARSFLFHLVDFKVIKEAVWITKETSQLVTKNYWNMDTATFKSTNPEHLLGYLTTLLDNDSHRARLVAFTGAIKTKKDQTDIIKMGSRRDMNSKRYKKTLQRLEARGDAFYNSLLLRVLEEAKPNSTEIKAPPLFDFVV